MIAGIDLAGPSNYDDTACAIMGEDRNIVIYSSLSDSDLFDLLNEHEVTHVAIDAPLSYSESGGYRDSDRALRILLNENGFNGIGVMAPTYSRMIYLTARGIRLTRLFQQLQQKPVCYEAHPGAFLAFEGYSYEALRTIKDSRSSIITIQNEIESYGYKFSRKCTSDHELMAVGALLACESKVAGKIHWEMDDNYPDGFLFIA